MRFSRRECRPDVPLPRVPRSELIDSRADNALCKHLETRRLIVGLIDLVPLSVSFMVCAEGMLQPVRLCGQQVLTLHRQGQMQAHRLWQPWCF